MKIRKLSLLISLLISSPFAYTADITIINNTSHDGTGYINFSPCSSSAGEKGILRPGQSMEVSDSVVSTFCPFGNCKAHLFLTDNCSGKKIATATLDKNKGVTAIDNLDKEHYIITGGGTQVAISPVSRGWKDWFSWVF